MPVFRAFLQSLGAVVLLALALACGGTTSSSSAAANTVIVGGTVTYTRVPLAKDANGVPTGLMDATVATNLQTLPARGAVVVVYQQVEETQPDGTKSLVWIMAKRGFTDPLGRYAMTVTKDRPTMVELQSSFDGGNTLLVNLIGEPAGMQSLTPVLDRLKYALRKAADGSAPTGVSTPTSMLTAESTVNFSVGLKDAWWLVDAAYNLSSGEAPFVTQAVLETDQPGRTAGEGSGSRVLAIGDTLASHLAVYAIGTPGITLDLHYWPGLSEPRGTYIEYDPQVFPQAYDPTKNQNRLFGSIRGAVTNDDAYDEGVLLPLFARNALYTGNLGRTFSNGLNPLHPISEALTQLSPDMARIEGLAEAMAATILKSPYLADTQGTGLVSLKDIRELTGLGSADLSPYSARAIRALAWEIILKANSLPSPGVDSDWATINPLATTRFFTHPASPTLAATDTTIARDLEPLNIYSQLTRLAEAKGTAEPVDLAARFPEATLTTLVQPFGLTWPRPTTGPEALFLLNWGTDPNSNLTPLPPVTLSMASATQVNGTYPNLSRGEVAYAGFSLSTDKRYVISATISPALAAGATVELDLPFLPRTFSFGGTGSSLEPIVVPMNGTAPYFHPARLRLKSPGNLQPDVTVTVAFTPAP